jgi:small acid-soluble spore protein E (minor gamma-type SASP)
VVGLFYCKKFLADKKRLCAHVSVYGGENPLTKKPNQTNANQVRQQNQQSAQGQSNRMSEEFASETDVNEVRQQNQRSEANKQNASGQRANRFENGTK